MQDATPPAGVIVASMTEVENDASARHSYRHEFGVLIFGTQYIRCVPKKEDTCLIITLANVDRYSKSFHQLICEKILYVHRQRTHRMYR